MEFYYIRQKQGFYSLFKKRDGIGNEQEIFKHPDKNTVVNYSDRNKLYPLIYPKYGGFAVKINKKLPLWVKKWDDTLEEIKENCNFSNKTGDTENNMSLFSKCEIDKEKVLEEMEKQLWQQMAQAVENSKPYVAVDQLKKLHQLRELQEQLDID